MPEVRRLAPGEAEAAFDDLARLRIAVFREWPYLYDGDLAYERAYLGRFLASPGAVIVGALDGGRLVGAATASPLDDHFEDFAAPFRAAGIDTRPLFYFGESVLEKPYRGRGAGVRFFEEREKAAREGGFTACVFSAVTRPGDHPSRPAGYRPLDRFWQRRGYRRIEGLASSFSWKDLGQEGETAKPMEFWRKDL